MPELPGVILAGGRSRRMGGGDKPLAPLAGRPMLACIIARLAPQAGPLVLNANGDPARFAPFGLEVVADTLEGHQGPLAGLLAGLEWAEGAGHAAILTVAADTPFFPENLADVLAAAARRVPGGLAIAATRETGGALRRHPTFGHWPVALRGALAEALGAGERRIGAFADTHGAALAPFADANAFFNVNTPEDRAEAERRLAGRERPAGRRPSCSRD